MPKRFTPTPAMLVALLALFLAAGGVGYAATSIGSGQITNNSIRSADIRDGTLAPRDLAAKTRSLLRGTDGARGRTGARGLEGATGPVGPTSAAGATNVVARTDSVACVGTTTGSGQFSVSRGARDGRGRRDHHGGTRTPLVQSGPVDVSGTLPIAAGAVPTGWRLRS